MEVVADLSAVKAFSSNISLAIFAFLIIKIVKKRQQLIRLVVYMYFCFFICKNWKMETAVGVPTAEAFLSNMFLVVFAFLIVEIVTQGQ